MPAKCPVKTEVSLIWPFGSFLFNSFQKIEKMSGRLVDRPLILFVGQSSVFRYSLAPMCQKIRIISEPFFLQDPLFLQDLVLLEIPQT